MAAWTNYKRLKTAGMVNLSVSDSTSGQLFINTAKARHDTETGVRLPDTTELLGMDEANLRRAEMAKDLGNLDAWLIDAQAALDAYNAAHPQPPSEPARTGMKEGG